MAAHVARREGLPLPIPATLVFPAVPETFEETWQREVLSHLGIDRWERVTIAEELDFLGPVARRALMRHGLRWPVNAHSHAPLLEMATGGRLLTGIDGDGLMQGWRWARAAAGRGGLPRSLREASTRVHAASPRAVRYARSRRKARVRPWLAPAAQRALARRIASEQAEEPARWDRRVPWWHRRRYLSVVERTLDLHAADAGAVVAHPLRDRVFLGALARDGGRRGLGDRTALMTYLFGDLLPPHVVARAGKATFGRAFWGRRSDEVARAWDGGGIDETLVDVAELQRVWRQPDPDTRTALLLQQVWLQTRQALDED